MTSVDVSSPKKEVDVLTTMCLFVRQNDSFRLDSKFSEQANCRPLIMIYISTTDVTGLQSCWITPLLVMLNPSPCRLRKTNPTAWKRMKVFQQPTTPDKCAVQMWSIYFNDDNWCGYKNSSGDEIANVNFYAVRPEGTRIR